MSDKKYRALADLRYPDGADEVRKAKLDKGYDTIKWKTVEAGEVVSDIPPESVPWLLAQGSIEIAGSEKKEAKA